MSDKVVLKEDINEIELPPIRLLTTEDNPFNPFTQWDEWFLYDSHHGYHTCAYLARIANLSHDLSELDQALSINEAIDEILKFNITGNYVAIYEKTFEKKKGLIA